MALSIDFDPSMRGPIISEVQPAFPSSGRIFVQDPSLSQAFDMGLLSKVVITSQEASLYKTLREKPLDGTESPKSDQLLMAEDVLVGAKRVQFRKAYPQIFPPIH